jgi:hypothetical protein
MKAAAARRATVTWVVISANLILYSCSTTTAPRPGTPAFFWGAARETYAAGDYGKTIEHLGRVTATENEFTALARPWLMVLTSGMARAHMELANNFEAGARVNRADPTSFRRQVTNHRGAASRLALQFAEEFEAFRKSAAEYVTLAFPYPSGSPGPVPLLTKVANGILPAAAELEAAQRRAIARGVLLNTCSAAGAADDPGRVQDLLKPGEAKVPRAAFFMAMASALFEQSQLFSRQKLDEPEKMKILCARAQEALKTLPPSKESKELSSKIEATLKRAKL